MITSHSIDGRGARNNLVVRHLIAPAILPDGLRANTRSLSWRISEAAFAAL
jgi:hypothetical protein